MADSDSKSSQRGQSSVEHQKTVAITHYDSKAYSRVLVLNTGGAIGSRPDASIKDQDIYHVVKSYAHLHDQQHATDLFGLQPLVLPDCHEPKKVSYLVQEYDWVKDESDMGVEGLKLIAKDIKENYDEFDGFVLLHETSSMPLMASVLSFMLEHLGKPVVLTGSQTSIFEPHSDGHEKFIKALVIAGCYDVPEVAIYFDRRLLRGNRCTEADSPFYAFHTPDLKPLAEVDGTGPTGIKVSQNLVWRDKSGQPFSVDTNFSEHVSLVGDAESLRDMLQPPTKGAVLQIFGGDDCTHKPTDQDIMDALKKATARGVLIVNIGQCNHGTKGDSDETGKVLADIGVIQAHGMTPEAGLAKLGYILGKTGLTREQQRAMVVKNLRGELSVEGTQEH